MSKPAAEVIPDSVRSAWDRVRADPPPAFPLDGQSNRSAELKGLVNLCFELAGRVWGGQFILTGKTAGTDRKSVV